MHEKREREQFQNTTNILELGIGRNLEGMEDFDEEKWFGLREKRERSRYLSVK